MKKLHWIILLLCAGALIVAALMFSGRKTEFGANQKVSEMTPTVTLAGTDIFPVVTGIGGTPANNSVSFSVLQSLIGNSATLASVSAYGSSTTNTLNLLAGFLSASSTVTSTFTVLGYSRFQGFTFTHSSGTDATTTNLFANFANFLTGNITNLSVTGTVAGVGLGFNFINGTGTNLIASNATTTNWFAFQSATGTLFNIFGLNVSSTIDTASGTKMTCGGLDCRRTITASAQGGTPPEIRGAATATLFYLPTNHVTLWLSALPHAVQSQLQWSVSFPNDYDGGTLFCHVNYVSTSTATFANYSFGLRAVAIASGGSIDASWGATGTWGVVNSAAANVLSSTSDTTITVGGSPTGATELWLEASRLSNDTATTTANLKSVECSYGVNKFTSF